MPSKNSPIYQLKISLSHIRPLIWRRILVPGIMPLGRLHDVFQAAMGWSDYHLHQFTIDNLDYGDPSFNGEYDMNLLNEWGVRLNQLVQKAGTRFKYEYDFGDGWIHEIILEEILPPDPKMRHPVCLAGKNACPPEDVGGPVGYARFIHAISHPRDEEHDSYLAWIGGTFNPAAFDLTAVNRKLARLKKRGTLDLDDWGYEPEYLEIGKPETPPPPDTAWLGDFSSQYASTAEPLTLRRDMVIFLNYLQANRVKGTSSTGNLPIKAGQEICAALSKPVPFGTSIGDRLYKVQSTSDVWPLFLLHLLASTGGLVEGGPGRYWKVTSLGENFLRAPAGVQVWLLFNTWMTQVNWGIAVSFSPENYPTQELRPVVVRHLLALPHENPFSFDLFADQIIADARMSWPVGDAEYKQQILRGIIGSTVSEPMTEFGVLELKNRSKIILGVDFPEVDSVRLTAFGREMLLHSV